MTATENSPAHPIEDFVWCENCGCPHAADFETMTLSEGEPYGGDTCEAIDPVEEDVALPKDWDRSYHATYTQDPDGGGGYDLWLKRPPLQSYHHPMYYLERS